MECLGSPLGRGNTADIFDKGDGKVLKLYVEGFSLYHIEHEVKTTQNVNERFGFAPKVLGTEEIGGRLGIIYERMHGGTMMDMMQRRLWTVGNLARRMAEYHVMMQQECDFEMPTVKDKLKRNIGEVNLLTDDEKRRVIEYMDMLPDGNRLCHFDFHPDNIMYRNDKPVVIDWMTACMGDPLSDAARTILLLKHGVAMSKSRIQNAVIDRVRAHVCEQYMREYIKLTGAGLQDIGRWELPIAAARLNERPPEREKEKLLNIVRKGIE